ncbi:hypothetical protein [Leptolyngbya sp. FACHB-261]|uniref:hypothetical protein n=1 Tax=Leptolyngbya sp. FACHB-261 TaxID=2692806 RepID=UPI00168346E1|nr:hypothetical protein [Leptolyngbya sp. FACHB-261]MBD2103892.1 hypothetical protein [Leptolyngbya sp. FACHB-261]
MQSNLQSAAQVLRSIEQVLRRVFRQNLLTLGFMILVSALGLYLAINQPAYAGVNLATESATSQKIDRSYEYSQSTGDREEAYEEAVEAASNEKTQEELYEKDLQEYRESKPSQGIVEGAKELLDKVTGDQ